MNATRPQFWQTAGRILNAGQARTLLLTGNIHDLFYVEELGDRGEYVPIVETLLAKWSLPGRILATYELNGPIRFVRESDRDHVRDAWLRWRTGMNADELAIRRMLAEGKVKADLEIMGRAFDDNLRAASGNATLAFELLRQMCLCSRTVIDGAPMLEENLIIVIEAADMAIPDAPTNRMSDADRYRVSICQDWFSDPAFAEARDSVILLAESRSMIHQRVARLPQVLEVEVSPPGREQRRAFVDWFDARQPPEPKARTWGSTDDLAASTAGLSIHALRQLLLGACYQGEPLSPQQVVAKVEEFIKSQLGDDVVEFKKPGHGLDQVIGFTALKTFLRESLIPRFRSSGTDAISGAAVCGPIGSGKTFIFEAVAAELDMVVLVLKNLRSKWYGETDVIFERLRRVLVALDKVLIFVDEADTQFGGLGADTHETERRLTGKIQAMISDTTLRGKVTWLLMTARIHRLSADIRRPGRVGDLIIPVLDPEGDDKTAFVRWMVQPVLDRNLTKKEERSLLEATEGFFAASFASMRSELKARAARGPMDFDAILATLNDYLSPDIAAVRRYQTLQALVNCTRRSLLPDPTVTETDREEWIREIAELELRGIS